MIRVFGITGTNGKTTVSWMLRSILEENAPCGLIGTIEHAVGDEHYTPENTTPGTDVIFELFRKMSEKEISQCVMEVSSHGIDQGRIADVVFSGVGFTNLSRDHMDYHKDMEQYFNIKKKLFLNEKLCSSINIDDLYGRKLYNETVSCYGNNMIKSCSFNYPYADFYGKIIYHDIRGTAFDLYENGKLMGAVEVTVPGVHFALDALLAAAMARQSGSSFEAVKNGIKKVNSIPGRMDCIGSIEDTLGIVDYAHTPDSLEKLLETAYEMKKGKLLCVFGCGGLRDKGKRRIMGEIAGKYSDYCIITNDNPRGEAPENIAQAIEEGLYPTGCGYSVILDRYQAIKRAVSLSDKWDIIVVAGKGHEKCQISGSECIPFDDKKVLKELLEKKYEKTYNETD